MSWRGKDHGWLRTSVAVLSSVPLTVVGGLVIGRWLPVGADWAFALGYLGPFLAWPLVFLGLIRARTGLHALAWCGLFLLFGLVLVLA